MKERPILFSGSMVRALLAGTKNQTRRVAKVESTLGIDSILAPRRAGGHAATYLLPDQAAEAAACCPYGQPGDRLWVRESHWWFKDECDHETGYYPPALTADDVEYRADGESTRHGWRPSIHMPRWASRITLEITRVRVERLQDISEEDAYAEGIEQTDFIEDAEHQEPATGAPPGRYAYRALWESINGPDSWSQNPWVWVVEFKRVQQASSGRPSQLEDAPCNE